MRLLEIVRASADVASTASRLAKTRRLADLLREVSPAEVPVAVAYLAGELPQGSIGVGWASLRDLPPPAEDPALDLMDVDAAVERIAAATGPGSQAERHRELSALYAAATREERRFLTSVLLGDLRQGALEAAMVAAVAEAAEVPAPDVRRALMLSGDLGEVAAAALSRGRRGLAAFRLKLFRPLKPMLASPAEGLEDALERAGGAGAVEWKLDGARLQVHRDAGEVRAYTRNLADVTDRVPEIVDAVLALPVRSVILDGEAIALRRDGRPHPFQVTMGRFGSRLDVERMARRRPLSAFFFDCLHVDGDDLIDSPLSARLAALDRAVPPRLRPPRLITGDAAAARAFMDGTLSRGHEGVMIKSLEAAYQAGRRGAAWLKVKPAHTLDLVVLAAEWGHGRRRGFLSNLHLGARDGAGGFVMLGKTFKGMTDEMLAWQTERLLALETGRDGHVVTVRPELVVEVAFDGLQSSPRYPARLALRFARVKGYRPDKGVDGADAIETVRAIHEASRL